MKRICLVVILVFVLLSCTACKEELPPVGEVVDNMVKALNEVESFRQDTDMMIQLYFMAEDMPSFFPLDINVELNTVTTHDLVNNEMETVMDLVITGADDDSLKMDMAFYLIDGDMYVMVDYPVISPVWTKSEIPDMLTQQKDNFQILTKFLQSSDMEITGTERKEGVNCYVLEATPDISQVLESLMGLIGGYDVGYSESDREVIDKVFQDFSIKLWVAYDTYHIVYADVNFKTEFSPQTVGVYDEEGLFSLDIDVKTHFHHYNRSVEIELPPEAEEADKGFTW